MQVCVLKALRGSQRPEASTCLEYPAGTHTPTTLLSMLAASWQIVLAAILDHALHTLSPHVYPVNYL